MSKDGAVLKWLALGCGIAVLLVVIGVASCFGLCGACAGGFYAATMAPASATEAFLKNLAEGRLDEAYGAMTPRYQAEHSEEDFRRVVGEVPHLGSLGDVTLNNRSLGPDGALMGGYVTTPSGRFPAEVRLTRHGERWLIDSFSLSGEALSPPLSSRRSDGAPSLSDEPSGKEAEDALSSSSR